MSFSRKSPRWSRVACAPPRSPVAVAALVCCFALVVGACGSGSSSSSSGSARATRVTGSPSTLAEPSAVFPVTVSSAQGAVTIKSRPAAIVSLSPTATEMLFAVGAGPQVIAVDDQSNYPPAAPRSQLSGFTPNVEAIAAKRPDLVVIADDGAGVSAALARIDIRTLVDPAAKTLQDTYSQIDQLGRATGHPAAARALVGTTRGQIDHLVRSALHPVPRLRVYHELDNTLYSATSSTFIGQLYRLLGADDIADAADKTGSGYPQLSAEYVVRANPDAIFLSDVKCCHQDRSTLAARPGWSGMAAITKGNVVALDDDVASRWGPRVVELVRAIARGLRLATGRS